MELFHYHHWTDKVEEMELFYVKNGFTVVGRFGKEKTYHPPLKWNDFREEQPVFRIIEVRKGSVNVTFGTGKKSMFDHIGYLVDQDEHDELCQKAEQIGWAVQSNERRTFLSTPFGLRVELQTDRTIIDNEPAKIEGMVIQTKKTDGLMDFHDLFDSSEHIQFVHSDSLLLKEVRIDQESPSKSIQDPCGVKLAFFRGEV